MRDAILSEIRQVLNQGVAPPGYLCVYGWDWDRIKVASVNRCTYMIRSICNWHALVVSFAAVCVAAAPKELTEAGVFIGDCSTHPTSRHFDDDFRLSSFASVLVF